MNRTDILNFLGQYDYDIRKTGDARWIDQKCAYDVVCIIADCIVNYVEDNEHREFTISDIWNNDYSRDNIMDIFFKPDPQLKAKNEYDKFFSQPIKLLSYSHILNSKKAGRGYVFSVNNIELLEHIAMRDINALNFLVLYIEKVLTDSGIYNSFQDFFVDQTDDSYLDVKKKFSDFTIKYTKINGETECNRIFIKVLNPLAFKHRKCGTLRGRISKMLITLSDLAYNRPNWRDELSHKDKCTTRKEHEGYTEKDKKQIAYTKYTVGKAKKYVRKFNDTYCKGISEINQSGENKKATQMHHIFSQKDYPSIANYIENIIALTPNQHFLYAHPANNTQYINHDFQYICLLAKTGTIYEDLRIEVKRKHLYDFDAYKIVLNTGFETEEFDEVAYLDFVSILRKIDYYFSDFNTDNKVEYEVLKNNNYPNFEEYYLPDKVAEEPDYNGWQ